MGLTATQMITRTHALLNQNSLNTSNYVTNAMILDFLNEGITVSCKLGKVYDVLKTLSTDTSGRIPLSSIEASTPASSDIYYVDAANIYSSTGEALTRIKAEDRGKLFQGTEVGTVADHVQYYYKFGQYIYALPSVTGVVLNLELYALPQGLLVLSGASGADYTTPPFDDQYHYYLPIYAAFRGKQSYNSHNEAGTFLQQFAQGIGIDINLLKTDPEHV
jgi:hypothetical protein